MFNLNDPLNQEFQYLLSVSERAFCLNSYYDYYDHITEPKFINVVFDKQTYKLSYGQALLFDIIHSQCFQNEPDNIQLKEMFKRYLQTNKFGNSKKIDKELKAFIFSHHVKKNTTASFILQEIARLTLAINSKVGQSLSFYDLIQSAKRNPRIYDLIGYKVSNLSDKSLMEVNNEISDAATELLDILEDDKLSPYSRFLLGKSALNKGQMAQFLSSVGLRPTISGQVSEVPVETSFIEGLKTRTDYLLSSQVARKAQVISYTQVKKAGYTGRKIQLGVIDSELTHKETCDTKHGISVEFDTEDKLSKFSGRFTFPDNKLFDHTDTSQVGSTVQFFSPVTCSSEFEVDRLRISEKQITDISEDVHFRELFSKYFSDDSKSIMFSIPSNVTFDSLFEKDLLDAFDFGGMIYYESLDAIQLFPEDGKEITLKDEATAKRITNCEVIEDAFDECSLSLFEAIANELKRKLDELFEIPFAYAIIRRVKFKKHGTCKRCFGLDYVRIKDFNLGLISEKVLTNFMNQILLSAKHLLKAKILAESNFPEEAKEYLLIDSNGITPLKPFIFTPLEFEIDPENDLVITRFMIVDEHKQVDLDEDDEDLIIELDTFKIAINSEKLINALTENGSTASLKKQDFKITEDDTDFFFPKINNYELSGSMESLIKLLETKNRVEGLNNDYNAILNELLRIINEAGLDVNSNMLEVLLSTLVREEANLRKRPDFKEETLPLINVISITEANKNTSPAVFWSFEKQKQTLIRDFYDVEFDAPSHLDDIFI
jgi:hypothetical protein